MIARVVCLIEVEVGGVRRYFTPDGESVGALADGAAYGHPMPSECTYCSGSLMDGERLVPGAVVRPSSGEGWCDPRCAHAWCTPGLGDRPAEERRDRRVAADTEDRIDAALERYGLGSKSLAPAPRRNRPPPFDPTGPGLRMGADDVEDGTDGRADR